MYKLPESYIEGISYVRLSLGEKFHDRELVNKFNSDIKKVKNQYRELSETLKFYINILNCDIDDVEGLTTYTTKKTKKKKS